jgi:nephrocystin-4
VQGSLILRVLNLGRESKNNDAKLPEFDDARTKLKRKRVRAKPAWATPNSPIARDLAAGGGEGRRQVGLRCTCRLPAAGLVSAACKGT